MIRAALNLYRLLRDQPQREAAFLALHVTPTVQGRAATPYGDAPRSTRAQEASPPVAAVDAGNVAANLHTLPADPPFASMQEQAAVQGNHDLWAATHG